MNKYWNIPNKIFGLKVTIHRITINSHDHDHDSLTFSIQVGSEITSFRYGHEEGKEIFNDKSDNFINKTLFLDNVSNESTLDILIHNEKMKKKVEQYSIMIGEGNGEGEGEGIFFKKIFSDVDFKGIMKSEMFLEISICPLEPMIVKFIKKSSCLKSFFEIENIIKYSQIDKKLILPSNRNFYKDLVVINKNSNYEETPKGGELDIFSMKKIQFFYLVIEKAFMLIDNRVFYLLFYPEIEKRNIEIKLLEDVKSIIKCLVLSEKEIGIICIIFSLVFNKRSMDLNYLTYIRDVIGIVRKFIQQEYKENWGKIWNEIKDKYFKTLIHELNNNSMKIETSEICEKLLLNSNELIENSLKDENSTLENFRDRFMLTPGCIVLFEYIKKETIENFKYFTILSDIFKILVVDIDNIDDDDDMCIPSVNYFISNFIGETIYHYFSKIKRYFSGTDMKSDKIVLLNDLNLVLLLVDLFKQVVIQDNTIVDLLAFHSREKCGVEVRKYNNITELECCLKNRADMFNISLIKKEFEKIIDNINSICSLYSNSLLQDYQNDDKDKFFDKVIMLTKLNTLLSKKILDKCIFDVYSNKRKNLKKTKKFFGDKRITAKGEIVVKRIIGSLERKERHNRKSNKSGISNLLRNFIFSKQGIEDEKEVSDIVDSDNNSMKMIDSPTTPSQLALIHVKNWNCNNICIYIKSILMEEDEISYTDIEFVQFILKQENVDGKLVIENFQKCCEIIRINFNGIVQKVLLEHLLILYEQNKNK